MENKFKFKNNVIVAKVPINFRVISVYIFIRHAYTFFHSFCVSRGENKR